MNEPRHPTPIQLVNHAAGEPLDEALAAHVESCARCRERLEGLRRERDAMAPFLDAEGAVRRFEARAALEHGGGGRRWWRWAVPAVGVAAAVAVALMVAPGVLPTRGDAGGGDAGGVSAPNVSANGARLKGDGLLVSVHRLRAGEVTRLTGRPVPVRAGDRVRVGVVAPADGWVSLAGEESGVYVAVPDLTQIPVRAGAEFILPGSLVLGCQGPTESLRVEFVPRESALADATAPVTVDFRCERP